MSLSTLNAVTQAEVVRWLRVTSNSCSNTKNDSYVSYGNKLDLYQVKFILDKLIQACPTFNGEAEWLLEQEKKK